MSMDWFRWYHGTVNDPKFGLVAKKASASVAEVIAVWACLLEHASAADDRGNPGSPDFESIDFALGIDDGKARRIYERMRERALLDADTGRLSAWDKRQPKREDETAAERKRRQREREHELRVTAAVTNSESHDVTQSHADVTHGHDRGEESRGDEKCTTSLRSVAHSARATPVDLSIALRKHGVESRPADPRLIALAEQGVSVETVEAACKTARAAKPNERISPAYVVAIVERWAKDAAGIEARGARSPPARASPNGSRYASTIAALTGRSDPQPEDVIDVDSRTVSSTAAAIATRDG